MCSHQQPRGSVETGAPAKRVLQVCGGGEAPGIRIESTKGWPSEAFRFFLLVLQGCSAVWGEQNCRLQKLWKGTLALEIV